MFASSKSKIDRMRSSVFQSTNYKWIVFTVVGLGSITNVIHHGGVSIALPTIAQYFSVPLTTIQWVVLAESLTISAMLLPMGRLSDIVGRKPIYITGILIFGIMALLAGSSPSLSNSLQLSSPILLMIFFRIFQGLGAAMSQATGMAMITSVFSDEERGKSLGAHGSIIGTGGILGPIVGGILITYIGWQWVFWINVPLCLVTFLVTSLFLDSARFSGSASGTRSYDWIGASLSTAVLLTFLTTASNGATMGWFTPPIIGGIITFIVTLFLFIWWELKTESPMLDLTLFRTGPFSVGIATNYLSFLGVTSFRFLIPFYLQGALRLSPAQIAYVLIPNAVSRIIFGPLTGNLSDRFGRRPFTAAGLALCGIGLYMMGFMGENTSIWYVVVSIIVFSSGSGIFASPNSAAIFESAIQSRYGVVSALVNLSRNAGNVTGIAIATAIVAGTMMGNGYSSDVDAVMIAGKGSALLGIFISGMKLVYFSMGTVQILSSFANLITREPSLRSSA